MKELKGDFCKYYEMAAWLEEHIDEYLNQIAQYPRTISHGDLTNRNLMMGPEDKQKRTSMI